MIKNISNLGDAALYCDFGNDVNQEINSKVIKYFKNIKEKDIEGITNLTPSYNKLIISFDLKLTNFNSIKKLYKYIYPYKTRFYIGLIFLLLTSLSSLYFAELIGELVKVATESQKKIDTTALSLVVLLIA